MRSQVTPDKYRVKEIEANRFAMELLMPEHMVERSLFKLLDNGIDVDDAAERLAELFKVSTYRMSVRITELKLGNRYWERTELNEDKSNNRSRVRGRR